ncbi:MAG TPA: glycosyltransferase family 39 protein [Nitrolancea sp.]|nr:glycosyltransferase family 39 protein [Nitrolancea sp.]
MNVRIGRPQLGTLSHLVFPAGAGLILLLAGATFIYRLGSLPPGLLNAEAANGLLAREAVGHGGSLIVDAGNRSPLLAALIALAARPFGFDVFTARLGAALAGIATCGFTGLWLRRVFGSIWGIVGGLIVAGSFWIIVFSRVALSPIAGAAAVAALLWLLSEALARGSQTDAIAWYVGAGVAAGIGFMSDPVLRILPVLLVVALAFAAGEHRAELRHSEVVGLLLTLLAALMVAGPFVGHTLDTPSLLGFWTPTPGLPGGTITRASELLRGYGISLARLVWPLHGAIGLNLPDEPLLGPFILPWAVIGLVVVARQLRNRLALTGLCWAALLLLPTAAITVVHPGRLVELLPLLAVLPVAGIRFVAQRAPGQRARIGLVALVAILLIGNAAWSDWRYFHDWVHAPATTEAFSASVRDSLHAIDTLPASDFVLYSTSGHDDVLSYLKPANEDQESTRERVDFDGAELLPIPSNGAGYLVVPDSTPVDPALLQLVGSGALPDLAGSDYRVYRLDQRARDELPLAIPTTPFANGAAFLGTQLTAPSTGRLSVVLAWQPPPNGAVESLRVRLQPVDGTGPTQIVDASLPGNLLTQPYDLLRLVTFTAPAPGTSADLSVELLDAHGNPITGAGLDTDHFLFLNRYTFSR